MVMDIRPLHFTKHHNQNVSMQLHNWLCLVWLELSESKSHTRGGRTRSRAAIIADVAFISLWHFAQRKKTPGRNKRLCILTCLEVVCKVQAIYLYKLYCASALSWIQRLAQTEEDNLQPGINPPLAAAASDSVMVAVSKLLTESPHPLVSNTD